MAFNLEKFWSAERDEHLITAQQTFASLFDVFGQLLDVCEEAIRSGNKILFFGNGGSAADAQHLATELTIRYVSDRKPIAAVALTTDSSALTAAGNDMGFERIFSRQVEAIGRKGDVAIGISTSGKSANVLAALKSARGMGITCVGFSGRDGGNMHEVCDVLLVVPSDTTARIQEMHITLGQMLCGALEQRLGLIN
jgi:D-sedoheptulose 7-phosphate isomerase